MKESMESFLREVHKIDLRDANPELIVTYWANPDHLRKKMAKRDHKAWEEFARAKIPEGYKSLFKKIDEVKPPNGYLKLDKLYRTKTRLIIGSGPSGWEATLIQMLRPYSVPWIPGSSLKGAMRAVASEKLAEGEVIELFGSKESRGKLVVFGGFPTPDNEGLLTLDVMTPHYKEYYEGRGDRPPHEFSNPVPVKFPAVKEGVTFKFILLVPDSSYGRVEDLLRVTLTDKGVGGKRSSGYGLFEEIK